MLGRRFASAIMSEFQCLRRHHQTGWQQTQVLQSQLHILGSLQLHTSTETPAADLQQDHQQHQVQQQQQQQQELQQQALSGHGLGQTEQQQPAAVLTDSPQHPPTPALSEAERPQLFQQAAAAPVAAVGPRRVNPAAFGGSSGPRATREGIVHINSTHNNTHLVLTDRQSKVETWVSGGTVGYKNANKGSPMAAELAAKELARRALDKGFHSVVVKLKGVGKNKQFAVQSLAASGLTVTQLWDVTPIPYNGCRLPRRRRV